MGCEMADRQDVFDAISRERMHQDLRHGTVAENPHEIGQWLAIMRSEGGEAMDAYLSCESDDALREILQVIAVGVACLEQHGIVERRDDCPDRWRRGHD